MNDELRRFRASGTHVRARRQRQFSAPSVGLTAAAFVVAAMVWLRWSSVRQGVWVDLDVYVRGAQAVMHGERLYDVSVHHLPFTYSPFAAALFTPLALMPAFAARAVLTSLSVASYVIVCVVLSRRLHLSPVAATVVAVGGLTLEPFSRNLLLGQINLLLIVMIVVDCFVVPARGRGWLVGVAAGVKILPGAFVFYFALKRDWRAVAQSAAGFLASVAVGAIASPEATWRYWSGGFGSLGRFGAGAVVRSDNQSLSGVWLRLLRESSASPSSTVILCVLGIGVGLWVARRRLRHGDDVGAVVCIALGSLLASPISWTHHWLWIVPVLLVLVAQRRWVWTWLMAGLFWCAPMWFLMPGEMRDLRLSWWQQPVGAAYVIAGVALLGAFALQRPRRPAQAAATEESLPLSVRAERQAQAVA